MRSNYNITIILSNGLIYGSISNILRTPETFLLNFQNYSLIAIVFLFVNN